MKKFLHTIRYGIFRRISPWITMIIIKTGGPKLAAYLSYFTIDWGEMSKENTVLCLGRPSFEKDIKELRKNTRFNFPQVTAGFTRFQMCWFPRQMQVQTFYQPLKENHPQAEIKSAEYASYLIKLIQKKHNVVAILSANFDYWQDLGFKNICREINIPFLVLSREHTVIPSACDKVIKWYKTTQYKFNGTAIAVAGQGTKDVLLQVGSICLDDQITITGFPRYDAWNDVDTSIPLEERRLVTLLSFTMGYGADDTFIDVLKLFTKAAEKYQSNDVEFLIKTKDADDTNLVGQILKDHSLFPVRYSHEVNLFDVLPNSRLVINYNSLALLEALFAKTKISIPAWGECESVGKKTMYPADDEIVTNVVHFAYTPDALMATINEAVNNVPLKSKLLDENINNLISKYVYLPNDTNCSQEFEKFLLKYIQLSEFSSNKDLYEHTVDHKKCAY